MVHPNTRVSPAHSPMHALMPPRLRERACAASAAASFLLRREVGGYERIVTAPTSVLAQELKHTSSLASVLAKEPQILEGAPLDALQQARN